MKVGQPSISSLATLLTSESIQQMLIERSRNAALSFGLELLEQDVEQLCGSRYERKKLSELCHRGGSETTTIIVDGAKYQIRRPRVRSDRGEERLPSLEKLQEQDLLDDRIRDQMIRGVSTRNYAPVIGAYAEKLGISKSSASRAFVRASQKDLDALNGADLSGQSFVAIMVDGVEYADRVVVVALGITETLEKVPLGVREGDTENAVLVKDLLAGLIERGFKPACEKLLAVIDGGKALKKALKDVFGERVLIQRCWLHKLRNLKAYVPKQHHAQLLWRMKKLMALVRHDDAIRELESFTYWLSNISHDAAASLREVGVELITVHKLGLPRSLRQGLSSTNAIESLIGVIRDKTTRVRNWKSKKTDQILRWAASSIVQHKQKMRKLRGYRDAAVLIASLGKLEIHAEVA